ncbi:hypothetical protein Tco_1449770 [Tanacetum coccineum]
MPQLQAMIDQGVTAALAARDANRNGDDSHTSGTGGSDVVDSNVELLVMMLRYAMTWIGFEKENDWQSNGQTNVSRTSNLALVCLNFSWRCLNKVERYVGGLPDMIHGSVVASKPKTMQEATEMATELMDKKISTFAERQAENKRKLDNNHQAQQQLPKRQNVVLRKDHVMLRVVTLKPVIKKQLSSYIKAYCVEEPIEIMDREVKRLKQSRFPIFKVRWNSRRGPEFIWEREDRFQKKYPNLFTNRASSSNATSS